MNIALCHFRVGETDGVSLEMEKWKRVLEKLGHRVYFLAGSSGKENAYIIPELHYQHKQNDRFVKNAYEALKDYESEEDFKEDIFKFKDIIEEKLMDFIKSCDIDVLVPNNIWSLGWGLPAAMAFYRVAEKTGIKCLAHHHDFHWERERYKNPTCNFVREILDEILPPKAPNIEHVVINMIAKNEMKKRRGLDSVVVPNVFDFSGPSWNIDEYNKDFRQRLGIKENDIVILQATRVVRRKAIELAMDFIGELNSRKYLEILKSSGLYDGRSFKEDNKICFVIAGLIEDDSYKRTLEDKANKLNIKTLWINSLIEAERAVRDKEKLYSLWDAYAAADLVTYPSILEGWGNQFLEGVFAKKPILVYEYPVFKTDIKSKGFEYISIGDIYEIDKDGLFTLDHRLIEEAASCGVKLLTDIDHRNSVVERNFEIGKKYFSYEALEKLLSNIF